MYSIVISIYIDWISLKYKVKLFNCYAIWSYKNNTGTWYIELSYHYMSIELMQEIQGRFLTNKENNSYYINKNNPILIFSNADTI